MASRRSARSRRGKPGSATEVGRRATAPAQAENFLNGKQPPADTNFFVANPTDLPVTVPSPDRSGETPFSDLEKDFFACAPPEVAQKAPEPMRFDDLVPIEAPQPVDVKSFRREIPTGARRALNAASTARASFAGWLDQAGRRVRPGLASFKGRAAVIASTASRGSKVAFGAAARGSKAAFVAARSASAHTRAGARRVVGLLAERRGFALALAIVVVVAGVSVSVGVLASRGGSGARPRVSVATAPAPVMPAPAISESIASEPAPASSIAGPTLLAQAAPAETPAPVETPAAPVETQPAPVDAPAPPALDSHPSSTSEARPSHAAAPKRAHTHRRHTYSSRTDLLVPSFMTAPSQGIISRPPPAPAPANRPVFSR